MKNLMLPIVFVTLGCNAQIRPLNLKTDTVFLTHYLSTIHKQTKSYNSNTINVTMDKYLTILNQAIDYSRTPFPLSDQTSVNILLTPSTNRNQYFNNLNFGTRKDGSNNLSGTRFNKSYSEYSKKYDYLYRKD